MRKFSKILTVLLTLALLCGIFVSAAAATNGESTWTPKITEDSKNRYNDFDGLSTGNYWVNYRPYFASTSEVEGVNGNHYAQITFPQSAITETQYSSDTLYKANSNVQAGWQLGTHGNPSSSLTGYDYMIFDFDFGTDKYVHTYTENVTYKDANGVEKTESVTKYEYVDAIPEGISDAEKANYKLGYIGGFYNYLRLYDSANGANTHVSSNSGASAVQIGQKDGIWYVSADGTYGSADDIALSNQIGVFDHFTFVHQSIYAADGTFTGVKVYVYVNGELLKSVNVSATSTKKNDAGEVVATSNDIRIEKLTLTYYYYMADCVKYYPTYEEFSVHAKEFGSTASVCLDNLSLNWYKSDDAKADALDAFYADTPTAPIYNCDNVVYTDKYVTPNTDRYATVGDKDYYAMGAAFNKLENGSAITISADYKYYRVTKYVRDFKVIAENGAKFSLHPTSAALYNVSETVDGDTTTYRVQLKTSPTDRSWLNITGDERNHYTSFTDNTQANRATWNGVTTFYAQINDGDYSRGITSGVNTTRGIFEMYRNSTAPTHTGVATNYFYMTPYRNNANEWKAGDVTGYDYVIADVDFGTLRYTYTDAEGVSHTAFAGSVPEGATNVKPAYGAAMAVGITYKGYTTDAATSYTEGRYCDTLNFSVVYNENDGLYYASANSTYDAADILLSNKVGELDHASFVVDVANKKIVVFVNGQWIREFDYSSSNFKVMNIVGINATLPDAAKRSDCMALAIDNAAINWHKEVADTATGIDAFMNGDYKNGKLYNCDDIFYRSNYYVSQSSGNSWGIDVDGNVYYIKDAALEAIKRGSNVITSVDILDVTPMEGTFNFDVECVNGTKFTLSTDAAKGYDIIRDGDLYRVIINEDTYADREWLNVSGDENNRYNDFSTSSNSGAFGTVGHNNATTAAALQKVYIVGADGNGYWRIMNTNAYLLESGQAAHYTTDGGTPENWYTIDTYNASVSTHEHAYVSYDVDFGTDRYTFSYEALVEETTVVTTNSVAGAPTSKTVIKTLYKTVSSKEEYEAIKLNPSLLISTSSYTVRVKASEAANSTKYTNEILEIRCVNDDLDLAFVHGQHVLSFYGRTKATTSSSASEKNACMLYTVKDSEGNWYLSTNATYSEDDYLLCNEVGKFDHVSFILKVSNVDGNLAASTCYAFINGEFHCSGALNSSAHVRAIPQGIKMTIAGSSQKNQDRYAIALDNCAVNWFKSSEELDKYFANENYKTANLSTCPDSVYYVDNYINPNGWVSTDGGETIHFIKSDAEAAIEKLEEGGTIMSSCNNVNFIPGVDSFTYVGVRGAEFDVDESLILDYYIEKNGEVYTVRPTTSDDIATVEFYDSFGNLVYSEKLVRGRFIKYLFGVDVSTIDIKNETYSVLDNWYIEGTNTLATDFFFGYDDENPGVVKVKAQIKLYDKPLEFAVYLTNEFGIHQLVGYPFDYRTMDNFETQFEAAPSGATAILLYDLNTKYDIGLMTNSNSAIKIGTNKTLSLDLNGRTLIDGYSNYNVGAWGGIDGCAFIVGEGSTFNFYSSKEGAVWYQLKYNAVSGDRNIFSKGIVTSNAKNATVNFGSVYDKDGKCIIKSENFDVYGSLILASTASGADKNNTNFTVNVNGGTYYAFGIGRYAMIVSYLPKMTVNIKDSTFINDGAHNAYGIFSNQAANSDMYVNAYNSTFISPQTAYQNMVFNNASGVYTEHYYENCTIIAKGFAASKVTLGEGNLVACPGAVTLADGVSQSAKDINTSVHLSNYSTLINMAPTIPVYKVDENGDFVLDDKNNKILSHYLEREDLSITSFKKEVINDVTYYTIADSVYDTANWKNEYKFINNAYVTYKGEMPDVLETITYYVNGVAMGTSNEKWHKNSAVINPTTHPTTYDMGMYVANNLSWEKEGRANFNLVDYTVAGGFDNMLSNATLSTGMTYNIYIPAEVGITVTGVSENATLAAELFEYNGAKYYVVKVNLAAKDFDIVDLTVTFSVDSVLGGNAKIGTQALKADIVDYSTKVATTYGCGSAESALIYEMMNYKESVATYLAEASNATYTRNASTQAFYDLYATHENCGCAKELQFSASEVAEFTELSKKGLTGATYDIDSTGNIKMVFSGNSENLIVSVSYFDGMKTCTVMANYQDGYYVTEGVPAAYIDNVMTITVDNDVNDDIPAATGTYCLAAYINSANVPAEGKVVAEALYKYAMAAEAYKHIVKAQ